MLASSPAWACVCVETSNGVQLRAKAARVFRGRVLEVNKLSWAGEIGSVRHFSTELVFAVLERFKGPKAVTYRVFTGDCTVSEADVTCFNTCAARGEVGDEYVVFAFADQNGLSTLSRCGLHPMKEAWSQAKRLLVELRAEGAVEQ
jgi:hypothetical protein